MIKKNIDNIYIKGNLNFNKFISMTPCKMYYDKHCYKKCVDDQVIVQWKLKVKRSAP